VFYHVRKGPDMTHKILRLPGVKSESGLSRSMLYLKITQGLWPKPVKLAPRCVGWPADEVAALNAARIAGKSEEEIRRLVLKLVAARESATGAV
jgi:prophage regulatory protein